MTTETIKFIEIAHKHSFSNIELDITKIEEAIEIHGLGRLEEVLKDNCLSLVSLNAIENYPILTAEELEKSLSKCEQVFRICNALDCSIVVVNPSEFLPGQKEIMSNKFHDFVTSLMILASRYGVRLGFESVSYDNRVANTLAASVKALGAWGDEIGLVLDVFHMYRTRETISKIPRDIFDRLWIFHVSDAPDLPIEKVTDSDRVFPLDGVVDAPSYIAELAERKFAGPVSVELFNKRYWEMDPDFVIAKAKENLKKLGIV